MSRLDELAVELFDIEEEIIVLEYDLDSEEDNEIREGIFDQLDTLRCIQSDLNFEYQEECDVEA